MAKYGMRITINIPADLYRELKSKAATEGRTVKELILRSLEREVRGRGAPIIPSKRPGSLKLDNEKIYEIIPFP